MKALIAFLKKELLEQLRTGRLMLLSILFVLFGIMNPAVAKLTPWLLEVMADSLAVAPEVGQLKFPGSPVAGYANTFIFPCIEAGNIGYKIAQRLGGFDAYGPILLGLNAPINDLSRGCNALEVYSMAIITAALA